jgi:NAD(P)-dependent dehydrogenase (short-subunit alcohol dehydrogenase family)
VDRVKGKIAIVTGGAKGIGRSACSLLAREGAAVALTDVLDESGRQAVGEIAKAGGTAHFWLSTSAPANALSMLRRACCSGRSCMRGGNSRILFH